MATRSTLWKFAGRPDSIKVGYRKCLESYVKVALVLAACASLFLAVVLVAFPKNSSNLLFKDGPDYPSLLFALRTIGIMFGANCVLQASAVASTNGPKRDLLFSSLSFGAPSVWLVFWGKESNNLTPEGLVACLTFGITFMLVCIVALILSIYQTQVPSEAGIISWGSSSSGQNPSITSLQAPLVTSEHNSEQVEEEEKESQGSQDTYDRLTRGANSFLVHNKANDKDEQDSPNQAAPEESSSRQGLWRLYRIAKPHRGAILLGLIVLAVRIPFSLGVTFFVSSALDNIVTGGPSKEFQDTVILVFLCGIGDSILNFWCIYLIELALQRIIRDLRKAVFKSVLSQEIGFFDSMPSGEVVSRITSDTATMAIDLKWAFRFLPECVIRICYVGGYMLSTCWQLGLLACMVIPATAVLSRLYSNWLGKTQIKIQDALAMSNSVATEVISAIRTVVSFGKEDAEFRRFSYSVERFYSLMKRQLLVTAMYFMICTTFLINTLVQASILIYGGYLYHSGVMTDGQVLITFIIFQGQLQGYFNSLFTAYTSLIKSFATTRKVFDLLDRKPRKSPRLQPVSMPSSSFHKRPTGHVKFDNVYFSYPTRLNTQILQGVTFEALPGEVVALVGGSGGGKSTCFHLLEKMYEPSKGTVSVDGVDVRDINKLHSFLSLVGQEPVLLSGTVLDAVLYGVCEPEDRATEEQRAEWLPKVVSACQAANAHDFIMKMDKGYESQVGERGAQLSGGQKQRIAIARCLIMNPAVLLLDEATSALDSESESMVLPPLPTHSPPAFAGLPLCICLSGSLRFSVIIDSQVQRALDNAMQNRTTLVIAHRLSTVRNAHKIVVVFGGRVVETGTHDELMAKPSRPGIPSYRALAERQMLQQPPQPSLSARQALITQYSNQAYHLGDAPASARAAADSRRRLTEMMSGSVDPFGMSLSLSLGSPLGASFNTNL